jgi:hypothetical protein
LGDQRWIEADPDAHRVIIVPAPSTTNGWFQMPMTIVRWTMLEEPSPTDEPGLSDPSTAEAAL